MPSRNLQSCATSCNLASKCNLKKMHKISCLLLKVWPKQSLEHTKPPKNKWTRCAEFIHVTYVYIFTKIIITEETIGLHDQDAGKYLCHVPAHHFVRPLTHTNFSLPLHVASADSLAFKGQWVLLFRFLHQCPHTICYIKMHFCSTCCLCNKVHQCKWQAMPSLV